MKYLLKKIILLLALIIIGGLVYSHPGRTDENGGHWDHSTGTYHYHTGEYAGQPYTSAPSSSHSHNSNVWLIVLVILSPLLISLAINILLLPSTIYKWIRKRAKQSSLTQSATTESSNSAQIPPKHAIGLNTPIWTWIDNNHMADKALLKFYREDWFFPEINKKLLECLFLNDGERNIISKIITAEDGYTCISLKSGSVYRCPIFQSVDDSILPPNTIIELNNVRWVKIRDLDNPNGKIKLYIDISNQVFHRLSKEEFSVYKPQAIVTTIFGVDNLRHPAIRFYTWRNGGWRDIPMISTDGAVEGTMVQTADVFMGRLKRRDKYEDYVKINAIHIPLCHKKDNSALWNVKGEPHALTNEEIEQFTEYCEVVNSTFGRSMCFTLRQGGCCYIPMDKNDPTSVGVKLRCSEMKYVILSKEGENDITRIRTAECPDLREVEL